MQDVETPVDLHKSVDHLLNPYNLSSHKKPVHSSHSKNKPYHDEHHHYSSSKKVGEEIVLPPITFSPPRKKPDQ